VLERVRSLLLAESPNNIKVRRDYDTSLPDLIGDREKLIQAVLNIARNAVQAMQSNSTENAEVVLRTRAERQVTLSKNAIALLLNCKLSITGQAFLWISAIRFFTR
jgi:two-component system nitrogen regulation sensor histidine kinase GlnL